MEEAGLVAPVFNENQMKRNEKLLTLILHLFGQEYAQEAAQAGGKIPQTNGVKTGSGVVQFCLTL